MWHKLSSMVLAAAVLLTTSFAQGGDHAAWPTNWNNWSDPALWVTVGNPNNGNDPQTGYGSVGYTYQIGKYEVTAGQYTAFLNAVAQTDPYGLYNASMWSNTYGCKIQQSGASGSYTYSVAADYANRPVNYVSFWDAARFTNWLQSGDTESGAYHNVGDQALFGRNAGAKYVIPTENEWYKSAYFDPNKPGGAGYWDYPTGVDTPAPGVDLTELTNPGNNANYYGSLLPIDSPYYTALGGEFQLSDSPYGTFDQGGNVCEWNEAILYSSSRGLRGGSFGYDSDSLLASDRNDDSPSGEISDIGFRVASVPEPGSIILLVSGAIAALLCWRRRK